MRLYPKPPKPPISAALRRFSADPDLAPPSPPPPDPSHLTSETLSLLQSSDPTSWPANPNLGTLLSALPPPSVLKITRQLPDYQNALHFFNYLKSIPHLSDSAPYAFQAVLELAGREKALASGKMYELFTMSKDKNTPLLVNAGTLMINYFGRAKMLEEMMTVFDAMDAQVKNTHEIGGAYLM